MTAAGIHIPTLATERLTLRAPRRSDFEAYAAFRGSDRASFVGGPNTRIDAWQQFCALTGQWVLLGYGRWIMADKDSDQPLGVVGLHHPVEWPEPEIAWSVFADGEGRGLAFEAARASRAFAYGTLGWTTLVSCVDPENTRSLALAKRLGCTPDGAFQHDAFGTLPIWRHPAAEALT
ncbi:N-acetyltransferase [Rhodophyticola sp. CCM32]|uniref:GNAT family N-acetyltransferase n=1 Tax=Rhodophyticola sp. CCM32 TaxID=2916397 RepID=UPI00107F4F37|nr:GNAT family N-acetyltransferase [Rhodophyticola sp. CCM32]QBY01542.1 N-acetyltransferase [Rhodophyticola sp. CCM32]